MKACESYGLHIANNHGETESGDYVDCRFEDDDANTNINAYEAVYQD